jgi:hypothetical protein
MVRCRHDEVEQLHVAALAPHHHMEQRHSRNKAQPSGDGQVAGERGRGICGKGERRGRAGVDEVLRGDGRERCCSSFKNRGWVAG